MRWLFLDPDKPVGRLQYLISVLFFTVFWGAFYVIGGRIISPWPRTAYVGTMCVLFIWGLSMHKRMRDTSMRRWTPLAIMVALLPVFIFLAIDKLIGGSVGIFVYMFIVQLPAMLWPKKHEMDHLKEASGPVLK